MPPCRYCCGRRQFRLGTHYIFVFEKYLWSSGEGNRGWWGHRWATCSAITCILMHWILAADYYVYYSCSLNCGASHRRLEPNNRRKKRQRPLIVPNNPPTMLDDAAPNLFTPSKTCFKAAIHPFQQQINDNQLPILSDNEHTRRSSWIGNRGFGEIFIWDCHLHNYLLMALCCMCYLSNDSCFEY